MTKVVILGIGNLASHLYSTFKVCGQVQLVQLFNRSIEKIRHFENEIDITDDLFKLKEADVYIISTTDNAIAVISNTLPFKNKLVVHTSGSVPLSALSNKNRRGVFYPLQTFSKEKEVDFGAIPICIEAEYKMDFTVLKLLASSISDQVFRISCNQRKSLHIAAVFANNFTNHLYHISSQICEENKVPFDILKPLIAETLKKIETLSPKEAQTGPARRNDNTTMENHIDQLKTDYRKEIYTILSNAIKNTYKN